MDEVFGDWDPRVLPTLRLDRSGLVARARVTAVAALHLLLAVPALALAIVLTVALGLSPIGVGVVLLLAVVPAGAAVAGAHRRLAGRLLATPVDEPYRTPPRPGAIERVRTWLRDPARWRDYAFLWVSGTLGLAVSVALVAGAAILPAHLVVALVLGGWQAWWLVVAVVGGALLWWVAAPLLLRVRLQAEVAVLGPTAASAWQRRVADVSRSRAETVDHQAAELRRIERDLHDGTQARIASLGISLGLAERLLRDDPAGAERLLAEARDSTVAALSELRGLVRGIHPPVLADLGLADAVEALAADLAVPVTCTVLLPGRAPAPVEAAVYLAVAECLANAVKHADAARVRVDLGHDGTSLLATVSDDGVGGAVIGEEGGLVGVRRRLAAFDGTMRADTAPGVGTTIRMEVPCALSSSRTTPSCATD